MGGEKHVIFDMDIMLSESLDSMIIDVCNQRLFGACRQNINEIIGRGSWRGDLSKLRKIMSRLADPDMAEVVPVIKMVFDEKKEMIESLRLDQDLKDEMLLAVSYQRKKFGVDQRRFKKNDDSAPRLERAH